MLLIIMGQLAQAARRLATGWTTRVQSRVSEGVEILLHSFGSRLVLGYRGISPGVKAAERRTSHPISS